MKDFICVSCWTSFQVDEATAAASASVACPKCGTPQPTGQSGGGGGSSFDDLPDEAAQTLEMSLPASLIAELSKGNSPFNFGPSDSPETTDLDLGLGTRKPAAAANAGASLDDLVPPRRAPMAPPVPIAPPLGAPAPAAAPPLGPPPVAPAAAKPGTLPAGAPPTPAPEEEAQWRMKMRSGLVLSFPTIDMVTAWASEKPADQMSIGYGELPFQPYAAFVEVFAAIPDPVAALKAAGQPRPKTNPGQALPVAAHASDHGGPGGEVVAAARAAAAAARHTSGDRQRPPTEFRFRTGKADNPWPKRLAILLVLALLIGSGVVGVLWWQGMIDLPFLDSLL